MCRKISAITEDTRWTCRTALPLTGKACVLLYKCRAIKHRLDAQNCCGPLVAEATNSWTSAEQTNEVRPIQRPWPRVAKPMYCSTIVVQTNAVWTHSTTLSLSRKPAYSKKQGKEVHVTETPLPLKGRCSRKLHIWAPVIADRLFSPGFTSLLLAGPSMIACSLFPHAVCRASGSCCEWV